MSRSVFKKREMETNPEFKKDHSYLMDRVSTNEFYWRGILEIKILAISESAYKVLVHNKTYWISKNIAHDSWKWQIREDLGVLNIEPA